MNVPLFQRYLLHSMHWRTQLAILVALAVIGWISVGWGSTILLAAPKEQATEATSMPSAVIRPGGATLYAQPGDASQSTLPAGTVVTPVGRSEDSQWVAIQLNGSSSWVESTTLIMVNATDLPITDGPITDSLATSAVTSIPSTPDATVALPTVTPTAQATATAVVNTITPSSPATLTTSAGQVAVVGASSAAWMDAQNGNIIRQLRPGTVVELSGRSADSAWVYGEISNDPTQRGWIASEQLYLSDLAALPIVDEDGTRVDTEVAIGATTEPSTVPANGIVQVTVASGDDRLNIRSGPGTAYSIMAKALDGEQYAATARSLDNEWLQIVIPNDSTVGWVSRDYVTLVGDAANLPVIEVEEALPSATATLQSAVLQSMDATSTSGAPTATGLTGTLVFQSSPGGTIYAYNLGTGATWSLTSGFDPEISPDGQTVVFVRDGGENGIYLIDIDGSNERLIFSGRTRLSSPKWSPDGQWILFTRSDGSYQCLEAGGSCIDLPSAPNGGGPEISDDDLVTRYWYNLARVDRDGNNYRDIGSLTSARAADWNEAGVVYQSDAGLQITADTPDSENKLVIFDYLKPFFEDPDWQPQGGRIVYMGKEASHTELFTVNPDGSGVTTLTRPTSALVDEIPSNVAPAWSPDGQHIVFLSNRTAENEAGEWRLWVMDADGSNQRPLSINIPVTYSYGSDQTVSWGPTI